MAAHTAESVHRSPAGRGSHIGRGRRTSPVLIGGVSVVMAAAYGSYAQFMARGGGPATFGQLWLALASGVGFALLLGGLMTVQWSLPRELRAVCWGALAGGSVGFLRSLGGFSIYTSAGLGIMIFFGVTLLTFYFFYTHEPSK